MLKGIAVSGGFAIGKILKLEEKTVEYAPRSRLQAEEELLRFERALAVFTRRAEQSAVRIRSIAGKAEADIFTGHIYMARDPLIGKEIRRKIALGYSTEMAMESACDGWIEDFSSARSEITRQKAADIRDIKSAVLNILAGTEKENKKIPFGSVVAARELKPSAVLFLDKRRTVAAVCEQGSRRAHFAVLAAAMGIPAVMGVRALMEHIRDGQRVIVDANKGEIIPIDK